MAPTVEQLSPGAIADFRAMLSVFGTAFEDVARYTDAQPSDAYIDALLGKSDFFAFVAKQGQTVIGAIAGYTLTKFERETAELYIYDLAVAENARRQGVATALIRAVQDLAAAQGAEVVFVQADYVDPPAIALYSKLGQREEVLHFDLPVSGTSA